MSSSTYAGFEKKIYNAGCRKCSTKPLYLLLMKILQAVKEKRQGVYIPKHMGEVVSMKK